MVAPALISAGASLLGGLLGRPKNVSAAKNRYDDVAGIFKAAEEFKFSPFALLGSPAVGPSVVQNTMGSAIADAGLLLADGMSKQKMKALEEERLRLENEKLRGEVNRMILRPKVPLGKPSIGRNNGGRNAVSGNADKVVSPRGAGGGGADSGANGLRPLPDKLTIDPRREVVNDPQKTHSGFMVVDNPYVGRVHVPTLDGDEPLGLNDIPSMIYAAPQLMWNFGRDYVLPQIKADAKTAEQARQKRRNARAERKPDWAAAAAAKAKKKADARQRHQELMAPFLRRQ